MSYQAIGLGAEPDDGTGDSLRIGADKVNDNFVELYTLLGDASDLSSGISATATVVTLTNPVITGPTISGTVGGTQTSATITTLTSTTISAATLSGLSSLAVGNLSFASGSITDSSGAISFGNENLTTTGTFNCSDITATGTLVFADGSIAIADLDIDGGTDIGAAVVAADLFIVDDGAGGTNRKTAASRIKTFVEASAMAVTGNVTATGTVEPAGDTAASDNAAIGYTSGEGLILTGQGSTSDVTIKNDADTTVISVATGTTAVTSVGTWNFSDQVISKPILKDYGETHNAIGGTGGGTQDIDLENGNVISATVDTSTNTFTFSNPTASANGCSFTLILTNGGSQTVNWPSSVDWAGGTAPSLTSSGTDILTFLTIDGGTIWHGFLASSDSK